MEGEKPTKYFCSLQKVVEKHTGIMELHIIEPIKDQAKIEEAIRDFYSFMLKETPQLLLLG